MPTYVYRRADGTRFEVFQRITDAPLTADPETGQPVERVISGGAGLQFKGTGFYLTDYARKGGERKEGGEKTEAKAEAKAEARPAKTDAKPAAKGGD
jgi:putative FmdB family regulatory protein